MKCVWWKLLVNNDTDKRAFIIKDTVFGNINERSQLRLPHHVKYNDNAVVKSTNQAVRH